MQFPFKIADFLGKWLEVEGNAALTFTTAWLGQLYDENPAQHIVWLGHPHAALFATDIDDAVLNRIVFGFADTAQAMGVMADELIRSGAVRACVFDLGSLQAPSAPGRISLERTACVMPPALETRLLGLAQKHQVMLLRVLPLWLQAQGLHRLVSFRVCAMHACGVSGKVSVQVLKDKVYGAYASAEILCQPPLGLATHAADESVKTQTPLYKKSVHG